MPDGDRRVSGVVAGKHPDGRLRAAERLIVDFEPRPPRWLRPVRDRVRRLPAGAIVWKLLVAVVGAAIVLLGLLLIPLPGPGWAIVFLGLAVWATEFHWAQRLLWHAQSTMRRWTDWAKRQPILVRICLLYTSDAADE